MSNTLANQLLNILTEPNQFVNDLYLEKANEIFIENSPYIISDQHDSKFFYKKKSVSASFSNGSYRYSTAWETYLKIKDIITNSEDCYFIKDESYSIVEPINLELINNLLSSSNKISGNLDILVMSCLNALLRHIVDKIDFKVSEDLLLKYNYIFENDTYTPTSQKIIEDCGHYITYCKRCKTPYQHFNNEKDYFEFSIEATNKNWIIGGLGHCVTCDGNPHKAYENGLITKEKLEYYKSHQIIHNKPSSMVSEIENLKFFPYSRCVCGYCQICGKTAKSA